MCFFLKFLVGILQLLMKIAAQLLLKVTGILDNVCFYVFFSLASWIICPTTDKNAKTLEILGNSLIYSFQMLVSAGRIVQFVILVT